MKKILLNINSTRDVGSRDPMIYGQFIEHFHTQIYNGIYDPKSKFSGADGLREDVCAAIKNIKPAILRWPGGCFVSAYNWKNGIGPDRIPQYNKAWQVEDTNKFGTDEFLAFCKKIEVAPYVCTNAGTGTPEEMSDWVEYCNLQDQGQWAKKRITNGHQNPHKVKYWSIGNENYGDWEMGAKTAEEWGRYVAESAKMMKAVDPGIELAAASIPELDWNLSLLREAGKYLDWISIHHYWDELWEINELSTYETCMAYSTTVGEKITTVENILGALGLQNKIRIAFDEWNLRAWHHPHRWTTKDFLTPRDKNDENSSYTMADAIFSACFLNQCLAHCNTVGMANFAPVVNTRGCIFTHSEGIVLRSTYFVFELYTKYMGDIVVDSWLGSNEYFSVLKSDNETNVPAIDAVVTRTEKDGNFQIALINRHPDKEIEIELCGIPVSPSSTIKKHTLNAPSKDSYNDIDSPLVVHIEHESIKLENEKIIVKLAAHSVSVLEI